MAVGSYSWARTMTCRWHSSARPGDERRRGREGVNTPLELFELLHETYRNTPKEKLLEFLKGAPDLADLSTLPHDELVLVYCERMAGTMNASGT